MFEEEGQILTCHVNITYDNGFQTYLSLFLKQHEGVFERKGQILTCPTADGRTENEKTRKELEGVHEELE